MSSKQKQQRRKQNSQLPRNDQHVSQHVSTVSVVRSFRYRANAAISTTITSDTFALRLLAVGSGATQTSSIVQNLRLRSVEVWAPPDPTTFAATTSVEFSDGAAVGTASQIFTDTALGSSQLAHVRCVPRPGSAASLWSDGTGITTWGVRIVLPINSIVDFTFEVVFKDDGNAGGVVTVAAATLGVLYMVDPVTNLQAVSFSRTI